MSRRFHIENKFRVNLFTNNMPCMFRIRDLQTDLILNQVISQGCKFEACMENFGIGTGTIPLRLITFESLVRINGFEFYAVVDFIRRVIKFDCFAIEHITTWWRKIRIITHRCNRRKLFTICTPCCGGYGCWHFGARLTKHIKNIPPIH